MAKIQNKTVQEQLQHKLRSLSKMELGWRQENTKKISRKTELRRRENKQKRKEFKHWWKLAQVSDIELKRKAEKEATQRE